MKSKSTYLIILFLIIGTTISKSQTINIIDDEPTGFKLCLHDTIINYYKKEELNISGDIFQPKDISYFEPSIGKPQITELDIWVLLPNKRMPQIKVEPGNPAVHNNVFLPPKQPLLLDCDTCIYNSYVIDSSAYQKDTFYPNYFYRTGEIVSKRGFNLLKLTILPIKYNASKKTLLEFSDFLLSIEYQGKAEKLDRNIYDEETEKLIANRVINFNSVIKQVKPDMNSILEMKSTTNGTEFLIITYDSFVETANLLKSWKENLGIVTEVITTSQISTTYDADSEFTRRDKIESYIDNIYSNYFPSPKYLLLLGDVEFIPTFYTNHTVNSCTGAWHAGDIQYADIDKPADFENEMAIGRIPANNILEANNTISKIIKFENGSLDPEFYKKVSVVGYFENNDKIHTDMKDTSYRRRFIKTCEDVREFLINEKNIFVDRNYYTNTDWYPTNYSNSYIFENDIAFQEMPYDLKKPQYSWNASASTIKNSIDEGRFLMLYRDHGSRDGWESWQYSKDLFLKSEINSLSNIEYPIIFSICCATGWFDNETDSEVLNTCNGSSTSLNDESFAEEFILSEYGASGVFAASRGSYSGANDRLAWGIFDGIYSGFIDYYNGDYSVPTNPSYRIGDVILHGYNYLATQSSTYTYTKTLQMFNYFGDPTMRVFPYNCEPGIIKLANKIIRNDKSIKACKEVVFDGDVYVIAGSLDVIAGSITVNGTFEARVGSTLSLDGADIKYEFR